MTRQDAGRLGGLQTLMRHGPEHLKIVGQRGGRPRSMTLAERRQLTALGTENKTEEVMAVQPDNLRVLKKLWRQQRSEPVVCQSGEAR